MRFNLKKHIIELQTKGITYIEGFYKKKECKNVINKLEKIINRKALKKYVDSKCQIIANPFRHDLSLINLIDDKRLEKIFSVLLDPNYVLIDSTVINRKINHKFKDSKKKKLGEQWHTDSRYNNNKRFDKGYSFLTISMFNDFSNDNSATLYIPESLNRKDRPPAINKKYRSKAITGKAGTIAILDTGIWHKAGKPSKLDRWSMFNYYGPWFMKPYFDFPKMMKKKKLKKKIKKLLHFNSQPPIHEKERFRTIQKL